MRVWKNFRACAKSPSASPKLAFGESSPQKLRPGFVDISFVRPVLRQIFLRLVLILKGIFFTKNLTQRNLTKNGSQMDCQQSLGCGSDMKSLKLACFVVMFGAAL